MLTRSRKAFTVVELLVVIAIIGVLVALTVPAIQMARESARKTQCMNNLGQLAKGVQLYAGARDEMPYSRAEYTVNRSVPPGTTQVLSWVYPILPQLEQQSVYEAIRDLGMPAAGDPLQLDVLWCPSQGEPLLPRAISYVVNGGRANYTGGTSVNEDHFANGAFIDMAMGSATTGKRRRKHDDCVDGTSNTFLIAENLSAVDWLVPYNPPNLPTNAYEKEQFSQFLWFPDTDPANTIFPNRHANPALRPMDVLLADFDVPDPLGTKYARPASFHTGGYHVAFWGGSTQFMSDTIDYTVYARLMTSDGARTQDPSDTGVPPTRPFPAWQGLPLSANDY